MGWMGTQLPKLSFLYPTGCIFYYYLMIIFIFTVDP